MSEYCEQHEMLQSTLDRLEVKIDQIHESLRLHDVDSARLMVRVGFLEKFVYGLAFLSLSTLATLVVRMISAGG